MNLNSKEILAQLKSLSNEKMIIHNKKFGAGDNQFGVKMGDIRALAKKIKTNHELALELWNTENVDARFLAILIIDPKKLSHDEINRLVKSENFRTLQTGCIQMLSKYFLIMKVCAKNGCNHLILCRLVPAGA
ncbi:DNA alkylation repair protein [Flavobacterium sp. N1736]|uniref:DNA alkylation repair protein n=1 Tax=Flavobacterium sp. N1736 TaxID=2986823 RepID=UPI0022251CA2|nr:DNA alkylation repair protein [Flavobacterium sp. N1736]